MIRSIRLRLAALALLATAAAPVPKPATPADIVKTAPATAWQAISADDLLVMTLEGGGRVVIQLAPLFAPDHVANIRKLAAAGWWDGKSVYRVQDNYVAQWGDVTEKLPMPPGIAADIKPIYTRPLAPMASRSVPLPYRDSYAAQVGYIDGWPVGTDATSAWLPHCYAMVGVARNLSPDAGTGAELYAVIGHAPRQLDRNIGVVGRVIEGIALLSSLPRGTGEMGFYGPPQRATSILSARIASALPPAEQPRYRQMDVASPSFAAFVRLRANRKDDFYDHPAGGVDLCNAPVPISPMP